jgi:uncharacterized protein (TIGR00266 family)
MEASVGANAAGASAASATAVVRPAAPSPLLQYTIHGSDLQFVELTLAPGAEVVGEPGAMMYMDEDLVQNTILGDGSKVGFLTRIWRSFRRMFTGESMFSVVYTNPAKLNRPQRVAFATTNIGKILAIDLDAMGGSIVCQRGAYLAGTRGITVRIAWQKKLRVGFFGGEGFVMQRLEGNGIVFITASGALAAMDLPAGKVLKVDSGSLVALQKSVTFDIKYAGRVKTAFFGGEGLFYASLKGPGRVWLQSLPMKRLSKVMWTQAVYGSQRGAMKWYVLGLIIFILSIVFGGDPGTKP